jgi:hypothetical protein
LEEVMRLSILASILSALILAAIAAPGPADAAKSKMGCEIGSEVWNAAAGKCEAGTPKYKRGSAEKKASAEPPAAKPAKKAAAKKKAPAAN